MPSSAVYPGRALKTRHNQLALVRCLANLVFAWIEKNDYSDQAILMFAALDLCINHPAGAARAFQIFHDGQPGLSLDDAFQQVLDQMDEDES